MRIEMRSEKSEIRNFESGILSRKSGISRFLALTIVLLTIASANFAQTNKIADVAAQASQVTEFDVNGMKVLVKRRAAAPTVAVGLFIKGGARNITDKNAGIENLTLGTAVDAGSKYSREAVRRELSRTGGGIGAGVSHDFSVVSFASTLRNFDKTWDIFTDVTLNPAFADEDITRERQQILTGLREQEISPDSALQTLESRVVYANHPYANSVNGNLQTISALTAADLKTYHKNLLQTSKLLLVIVGDLDANELKTRINAAFGGLPRGNYQDKPFPALDFSKATLDVVPRKLPTNYVEGVFNAPSLNSPEYPAMRVVMADLAGRVFNEVRVKRQLSYAPGADLDNDAANTANISVTAVDANQAVSVMLDEINKIKTEPLRSGDIARISEQFLTNYYLGQETNAAQAAELARYELIGGGWRNSFEFLNKVRAVKPADIQAAAKKYIKNIRFVVVGDPAAVNKEIFTQN